MEGTSRQHMAIDPKDFDKPVEDYSFDSTIATRNLIDQMSNAGGFTATKLAYARDILSDMKIQIEDLKADQSKILNWL